MNKTYKKKLLTIKVSDGHIDKEIQTDAQKVTVGKNIENIISCAQPALPDSLVLFEKKGGRFYLIISGQGADGSVTVGDSTISLSDLVTHGLLSQYDDKTYLYQIGEKCHGTIKLHEVQFSFSLSDAPPPPPIPTIPKEFRRKLFSKDDRSFITIMVVSLVIHLTAAILFETTPVQEKDIRDIKKIPKRFAKLILGVTDKQLKEITKKEKKKEAKKEDKSKAEEKEKVEEKEEKEEPKKEEKEKTEVVDKKEAPPEKTAEQKAAEEQKKRREKLKKQGVLAILVGKRASGSKKTVSHFIGNKDLSRDLDKVLASIGGLQNIKPTAKRSGADDRTAGIDDLIAKVSEEEKKKIKTLKLKKRKRANIEKLFDMAGSGAGDPKRSSQVIASVVQTYIGGLKYLYDRELRKDPTLEGKVVVRFTILANGKVTNCMVINTSMNNKRFEQSVIKRVRRWRFEPIEKGEVTITYPFIFFPVITG